MRSYGIDATAIRPDIGVRQPRTRQSTGVSSICSGHYDLRRSTMGGDDDHRSDDRRTTRRVVSAFARVWSYLVVEDDLDAVSGPVDALFCFGSRHHRVPERAAAAWHAGVADRVLLTGGPSAPGEMPEAERFAAVLHARGVPDRCIVTETCAGNTGENVRFGLAALRSVQPDPRRVALVGWPLSARRCRATFTRWAPQIDVVSIPALPAPGATWAPTDELIRWALGELARLRRYGDFGFIVPQPVPPAVLDAAHRLLAHVGGGSVVRNGRPSANHPTRHGVVTPRPTLVPQDSPLLDVQALGDLFGDRGGEIPVRLRPPTRVEQVQPAAG